MKLKTMQLLLLPIVCGLLVAPNALATARTEVRTYEAAAIFLSLSGFGDPVGVTSDGTVDVGGVAFDTQFDDTSAHISVVDSVKTTIDPANAGRVAGEVCQDLNADNQCDVSKSFCGAVDVQFTSDPLGFQAGLPLVVFVYLTESNTLVTIKPCAGNTLQRAYTGTITADFA